jgi:hypothetical protein
MVLAPIAEREQFRVFERKGTKKIAVYKCFGRFFSIFLEILNFGWY